MDPGLGHELDASIARREAAEIKANAAAPLDPVQSSIEATHLNQARAEVAYWRQRLASLTVVVPENLSEQGLVISSLPKDETGRWVEVGEAIATLSKRGAADTRRSAMALFDAADLAGSVPSVGDRAWFQPIATPEQRFPATITKVTPAGSRQLGEEFMEHLDLADLALNPATGEVGQAQFVVEVELESVDLPLKFGATGKLRLPSEPTPLGLVAVRKVMIFLAKL